MEHVHRVYHLLLDRFGHDRVARRALMWLLAFLHEAIRDQVLVRAAMLAYWTLVTLVPLLVLVFATLGLLGSDAAHRIEELLVQVLPASGAQRVQFQAALDEILAGVNFGTLGALGVVFVLFTASRIFFSVEEAYNALWNARPKRSWAIRMVLFYTTVTLAPLCIAAGFSLTGDPGGDGGWLGFAAPVAITAAAFVGAIRTLPDTEVRWVPALVGGLASAIAFEIAKVIFGLYLDVFSGTSITTKLYGSVAFLPVFLTWLYTLWLIVLIGVELAYSLQRREDLIAAEERRLGGETLARRHADALFAVQCLLVVARRYAAGEGATQEPAVTRALDSDPVFVRNALEILEDTGILAESPVGYLPAVPLERLTLREVVVRYRERTRPATAVGSPGADLIDELLSPAGTRMDVPVGGLIGAPVGG